MSQTGPGLPACIPHVGGRGPALRSSSAAFPGAISRSRNGSGVTGIQASVQDAGLTCSDTVLAPLLISLINAGGNVEHDWTVSQNGKQMPISTSHTKSVQTY